MGAFLFPSGEVFAVFTVMAVVGAGLLIGPAGGLTAGALVGFVFLTYRFLEPIAEFTEVIDQVQGPVDAYVGCVGTGGSMTGIARGLKLHNPRTRTIAVEPAGSIIFGQPGRPYYQSGTGTPKPLMEVVVFCVTVKDSSSPPTGTRPVTLSTWEINASGPCKRTVRG